MNAENITPATDLDDPYIKRYATKIADPTEVLLRADFARMRQMRDNMAHAENEAQIDQLEHDANLIEERWSNPASDQRENWEYLADAYADWKQAPETMRRFHDQMAHDRATGWDPLTGIQWRSLQQARELTGNGAWLAPSRAGDARESEAEPERTTEPFLDMPGAPTPGMPQQSDTTYSQQGAEPMTDTTAAHSPASALAYYQPGNAVAAARTDSERGGVTR